MKKALFLFLFPIFLLASDKITLSNFEPFESERNSELEETIKAKILNELKSAEYTIELLNATGKNAISESKKKGAKLHIGGYYKKNSKHPLEIYVQIYSTEKEIVIDAVSSVLKFDPNSGVEFAPEELAKLDNDRSSEISRKVATQLRINPEQTEQPQNINDELLNKKISRTIEFPVSQTGKEKDIMTKDTFQLLGSQEVETASRSKESIFDAPATILVITEEEIRQRGYTSLTEILENIPGMDISFSNSAPYTTPYMRGYRTDSGQKILFMIDSKPQNDLWQQSIRLSRQYPVTMVKKIEVLYGPSSVVYGPNATQGIINVITKDGKELKKDGMNSTVSLQAGSFNTNAIDATVNGKNGELSYMLSGKFFKSDEPDLSKQKQDSYTNNFYYGFRPIWGPVLDADVNGKKFGKYRDPSTENSFLGSLNYKGLKLGVIYEKIEGGTGTAYTGDQVQNNGNFGDESKMVYVEYEKLIGSKFRSYTQVYQREYTKMGTWTESLPNPTSEPVYDSLGNEVGTLDKPYESLVSNTYWQSINKMYQVNQIFDYKFNQFFKLSSGINFTNRNLTRNYDVPGYFGAFNSTLVDDFDKYPDGYNVVSSSSTDPLPVTPLPSSKQHPSNTANFQDQGGYALGTFDYNKFRLSAGVRYDQNSFYGSTVNPRVTGIYKYSAMQAFKLMYGEAFQEPTALQIYGDSGGANYGSLVSAGAVGNTNLKPEKMRSGEMVWILQGKSFYNEVSTFYNKYDRVIEQDFLSFYGKKIYGTEWKITKYFPNFIPSSGKISTFFNYSFTESWNTVIYDKDYVVMRNGEPVTGNYLAGGSAFGKYDKVYNNLIYPDTQIPLPRKRTYFSEGDIAKHKFNIGFNIPIMGVININLRGSYVGQRGLYTTNPLREEGIKTDPYFLWHGTFTYLFENYGSLSFKVYNIFNEFYIHPGVEFASGGNRYWERSVDFRNSLMPQPGRYFVINLTMTF